MEPLFRRSGTCPVCEEATQFNAWGPWLRDTYACGVCGSIPRERALMAAIQRFFPNWRELELHESSPSAMALSLRLQHECRRYVATQFDPSHARGELRPEGWRNEDLSAQTFADESFDLVVSQDVFEHLFDPAGAIREIARTLRAGGAHLCTIPLVAGLRPSHRRASLTVGNVVHHEAPEYHHNPIDPQGSLVTVDWGYDVAAYFNVHAPSLTTTLVFQRDLERGIEGDLTEVVMSLKRLPPVI